MFDRGGDSVQYTAINTNTDDHSVNNSGNRQGRLLSG